MKCDVCGSINTCIKSHKHLYTIKGKEIEFTSDRRFCKECNNLVYDSELDNIAANKAIELYNKQYGIDKDQIIELRKKYNLSIELFSKVIGCAKKTLISYEKGASIPNDSYLIMLRSLIAKPETILSIIEANKTQFSTKEYERINDKLSNFLVVDSTIFEPTEYNGYTKLNNNKIYNMILFFAQKGILKTKLLKEMFYADFLTYKENCKSMTGLEYVKWKLGPVPENFEKILNEGAFKKVISYECVFDNEYEYHIITSNKQFDKTVFDNDELKILEMIREKFKDFKSKEIADFSHNEKAFTETNFFDKISYDYAFDIKSMN